MLFEGRYCAILEMGFIQQVISANFSDVDEIPKVWLPIQSHRTPRGSQMGLSIS